eukprot:c37049_g1_i1.p1 GENE.c37049_g1_i1~~c37049_g1_i1.p1  ORF type:complete len:276 (-),score=50.03 c37049_g1_i1:22-849(-)
MKPIFFLFFFLAFWLITYIIFIYIYLSQISTLYSTNNNNFTLLASISSLNLNESSLKLSNSYHFLIVVESLENSWWSCLIRIGDISETLQIMGGFVTIAVVKENIHPQWKSFYSTRNIKLVNINEDILMIDNEKKIKIDIVIYSTFWWNFNSVYENESKKIRKKYPNIKKHVILSDDVGWFSTKQIYQSQNKTRQAWAQEYIQRYRQAQVYTEADLIITISNEDRDRIINDLIEINIKDNNNSNISRNYLLEKIKVVRYINNQISVINRSTKLRF